MSDADADEGAVRCELGHELRTNGERRVFFAVGATRLSLSPEEAMEIGGDLIRFAIECEDGGTAQDTIGGWPVARKADGE
jgi:hypothetical protein